jgi:hypothetical protein
MNKYKTAAFNGRAFMPIANHINNCKSDVATEPPFKKIAKSILLNYDGFQSIEEGPPDSKMKGVPFDLLGIIGQQTILCEVKGSRKDWSMPGKTQQARMKLLWEGLQKKGCQVDYYLLQISLSRNEYRLWKTVGVKSLLTGIDTSLGQMPPIEPILGWVCHRLLMPGPFPNSPLPPFEKKKHSVGVLEG